jgi:hypothetical protein
LQQDGDGIGLFAGRAAADPDPHLGARRLAGEQTRDDLALQHREGLGIAEKTGDADQQIAEQLVEFVGALLQIADIVALPVDLMQRHAPFGAADQGALLVLREVMAGAVAQQDADLAQRVLGLGVAGMARCRPLAEGMGDIVQEMGRHLRRRQHEIGQPGGDDTARHGVIGRRLGRLGHDQSALALDRPRPQGAVAAGAREQDTDRPFVLIERQRAEEEIDRQPQSLRPVGSSRRSVPWNSAMSRLGRDDVGAIRLDPHPVLDLLHAHTGIAFDQFGEHALVIGRQMLHQHEGHAGLRSGGMAEKNASKAASPPAEAPRPTIGKSDGCDGGRTRGPDRRNDPGRRPSRPAFRVDRLTGQRPSRRRPVC